MQLFSGIACFSPSVPRSLQQKWVSYGGTLAQTERERTEAEYFFCGRVDDPWVPELSARGVVVFHASWVKESIAQEFPLPISKFILNDRSYLAPLPILKPTVNHTCISQKPVTVLPQSPSMSGTPTPLTRKRPLGHPDASPPDPDNRTLKRARFLLKPIPRDKEKRGRESIMSAIEMIGRFDSDDRDREDEQRVARELVPAASPVRKTPPLPDKHAVFWSTLASAKGRVRLSASDALQVLRPAGSEEDWRYEDRTALFKHGAVWRGGVFAVQAIG